MKILKLLVTLLVVLILTACNNTPTPAPKIVVEEITVERYVRCEVLTSICPVLDLNNTEKQVTQLLECVSLRNEDIRIYNEGAQQCR